MTTPKRLQRRRTPGWRMPPDAIYVGRPSKWGNMQRVAPAFEADGIRIPEITQQGAVDIYRQHWERALQNWPSARQALEPLRGRDLVCWCRLDQPCHADVLLDLANRPLVCEATDG
jgi:hypothetical protein